MIWGCSVEDMELTTLRKKEEPNVSNYCDREPECVTAVLAEFDGCYKKNVSELEAAMKDVKIEDRVVHVRDHPQGSFASEQFNVCIVLMSYVTRATSPASRSSLRKHEAVTSHTSNLPNNAMHRTAGCSRLLPWAKVAPSHGPLTAALGSLGTTIAESLRSLRTFINVYTLKVCASPMTPLKDNERS